MNFRKLHTHAENSYHHIGMIAIDAEFVDQLINSLMRFIAATGIFQRVTSAHACESKLNAHLSQWPYTPPHAQVLEILFWTANP